MSLNVLNHTWKWKTHVRSISDHLIFNQIPTVPFYFPDYLSLPSVIPPSLGCFTMIIGPCVQMYIYMYIHLIYLFIFWSGLVSKGLLYDPGFSLEAVAWRWSNSNLLLFFGVDQKFVQSGFHFNWIGLIGSPQPHPALDLPVNRIFRLLVHKQTKKILGKPTGRLEFADCFRWISAAFSLLPEGSWDEASVGWSRLSCWIASASQPVPPKKKNGQRSGSNYPPQFLLHSLNLPQLSPASVRADVRPTRL